MRIVLDTNVLVAAVLKRGGPPHQLVTMWEEERFEVVTSEFQIEELRRVLTYEKIAPYLSESQVARLTILIRDFTIIVEPKQGVSLCNDPDDNIILGSAIAGKADLVISGDKKHVLPLGEVDGIPIVTPAEALQHLSLPGRPR